jgi:hypothetical protein
VFISISEGTELSKVTNVFSSDGDFLEYSVALSLNVHDSESSADF